MQQTSKAEQLKLPEQLYILLIDPNTGEPKFARQRVEQVMAVSIVWELLHAGALKTDGNNITGVDQAIFQESYLRRAALMAAGLKPISGHELTLDIASKLHPVWKVIGEDMVAEHLLTEEVRTRFIFFHHNILTELTEARKEAVELSVNLAQAARNLWDSNYDAELAQTHPRLLARFVLLDNSHLLEPILGTVAYNTAAPHLPSIRTYLHQMVRDAQPITSQGSTRSSTNDCSIYNTGSDFWIYNTYDTYGFSSNDSSGSHDHHSQDNCDCDCHTDSSGNCDCSCSDSGGGDCGGCGGCGS